MHKLGVKSEQILSTVEPVLQEVVRLAIQISDIDFSVVSGLRTFEEQENFVKSGVSRTMTSKHLVGKAVDLYPWKDGKTDHSDEAYKLLARAMFKASQKLGVTVSWGGLWINFIDNPHWELE